MSSHPLERKPKGKYYLPAKSFFPTSLLPVIQNLTALGLNPSEIGTVCGYSGEHSEDWLRNLKQNNSDVLDAVKEGKKIADAALVAKSYQNACGYDYQETEDLYNEVQDPSDPENTKTVKISTKVKTKHQPGNPTLAMFLLTNHLPNLYKNRIEQTRKGFVINATTELSGEQIERLAGALMSGVQERKQIDSKVIEAENG
jgi:hypothetical protein